MLAEPLVEAAGFVAVAEGFECEAGHEDVKTFQSKRGLARRATLAQNWNRGKNAAEHRRRWRQSGDRLRL